MNIPLLMQRLPLLATALATTLALAAPPERVRVGLVLGGGGARGAAHIGVLEELEKHRVPIDCIVGTSMGALVAGAYAAGRTPAEMRTELAQTDWNDMFQDNPTYSEINLRNKTLSRLFMPGSETGVTASGVEFQGGVVSGQKIKFFFNRLVYSDRGERNIEALPLPLSLIATDIGNGDRVALRQGSLSKAMRASMSIPGLLAPVDHQGRKFVDGGLVDNLPIAEARQLCQADVVIAVNVGSPLLKANEVGSLLSVSVQMINILTEQNVKASLALLKPTDIYIQPDLEGISASDFQRSSETADRGRAAAQGVAGRLQALSVGQPQYAQWRQKMAYVSQPLPPVDQIEVAGLQRVSPQAVTRHLRARPGAAVDDAGLNTDLLRSYGDGWYESVDYALLSERDRTILRLTPIEKPWGPDYLRVGVNFDTNLKQAGSYGLRLAYDKTWLNALGGQLLVIGQVGRSSALAFDLYQPLEATQRYFMETGVSYGRQISGVYQNNKKQAEYASRLRSAQIGLGLNVGVLGQIKVGWRQSHVATELETGVASATFPQTAGKSFGGRYLVVDFDQMDRLYFPTAGWAARLELFDAPKQQYNKVTADLGAAAMFGALVLNARLHYQGSARGQLPSYDAGTLGGPLSLAGFATNQLVGDDIRYANLRLEKILGRLPLGVRGDMRVGLSLEAARIGQPYTETELRGRLTSVSVYVGGETPLGPVYIGYGKSDRGPSNIYLFFGTP